MNAVANQARRQARLSDKFLEDSAAAGEFTGGMNSRKGYTLTSGQALDLMEAVGDALAHRSAFIQANQGNPDIDLSDLLGRDIVDLIVGENAIKTPPYATARWAAYEVLRMAKANSVQQLADTENTNSPPIVVVYFSIPAGTEIAQTIERLVKRAQEILPKSLQDVLVPEFILRFIGFSEEDAEEVPTE